MLNYKIFENNKDITQKFVKYSKIYGIVFVLLGILGIIFPNLMSITSAYFIAWLMLFSGIFTAIHTWQINKKDWLSWLKALLFIVVAVLIFANPLTGVITLGILFTAYFLVDSALNFTLAFKLRPNAGWLIALLNAILSLALGAYFFIAITNPLETMWAVGIVVGISLFFDGVMLLSLASAADNNPEANK